MQLQNLARGLERYGAAPCEERYRRPWPVCRKRKSPASRAWSAAMGQDLAGLIAGVTSCSCCWPPASEAQTGSQAGDR